MLPLVGVIYTKESALSREGAQLAQYVALCVASSGRCSKTWLVAVTNDGKDLDQSKLKSGAVALRCDGAVLDSCNFSADVYEETTNVKFLGACDLWLLMVDADATLEVASYLQKVLEKPSDSHPKRVVLSLQTAMRRLAQLNLALPEAIVLHGGAAFQVVKDVNERLKPLSSGCFFVERLSKEKSPALYALDVLESTGIQVLSRHNIQAMKWGCTMLRTFYYINALSGKSVIGGLRDRNTRYLFLQALVEMDELFQTVAASVASTEERSSRGGGVKSSPDTSAATLFPVQSLMILLPLPNWIFNFFVLRAFDLGLVASSSDDTSVISSDLKAIPPLQTNFDAELRDVFELAAKRNMALPVLTMLQNSLLYVKKQRHEEHQHLANCNTHLHIDSGFLLAGVDLSPRCTDASRNFFLKVFVTFILTLLLGLYIFIW